MTPDDPKPTAPDSSPERLAELAKAEDAAGVVDQQTAGSAAASEPASGA